MSAPAIRVERLGKQYRLGVRARADTTFRELLSGWFGAPLRRWRALRETGDDHTLFWALRELSFQVQPGEVVGIIGHNGAGKSTLLKILARITEPTCGRALIRGRVRSLLEVGTGFHGELTGRENVYLNGAILGMRRAEIERKFDQIVAFAGIEKFLDTPVKRYSSGMYVRLAFAVAAHLEPEILLIDEVLAVGDVRFQQKCLGKMADVARQGRTILFVSHNMAGIAQLCSRAIVLEAGQVVFDGPAPAAVRHYLARSGGTRGQLRFAERPGQPAQITAMALERGGRCLSRLDVSEGCTLRVDYHLRRWQPGTYVCVAVSNESGQDVLWSADVADAERLTVPRPCGRYRALVSIPAHVLAPGTYYCSAAICAIGRERSFDFRQRALCFEVRDERGMLERFGVRFPGITAIRLAWRTEHVAGQQPGAEPAGATAAPAAD